MKTEKINVAWYFVICFLLMAMGFCFGRLTKEKAICNVGICGSTKTTQVDTLIVFSYGKPKIPNGYKIVFNGERYNIKARDGYIPSPLECRTYEQAVKNAWRWFRLRNYDEQWLEIN